MPKVASFHHKHYDVTVNYTARDLVFTIRLPSELAKYASGGWLRAKTQREVEQKFESIVDQYIAEGAEHDKVIAIEVDGEVDSVVGDDMTRAGGEALILRLEYAVVDRVKVGGEYRYTYSERVGPQTREREFHPYGDVVFVQWTPSREAFVREAAEALKQLGRNLKAFVDSRDLAARIDARKPMLSLDAPGKEKP